VLIKNVLPHTDDLHDGRPVVAYETAEVSAEDFKLEHYQSRLRDGMLVVVSEDEIKPLSVAEIQAAIEAAPQDEREAVKAQYREAEKTSAHPRKGVLDATTPDKETGQ
jgi:hypothetical protein